MAKSSENNVVEPTSKEPTSKQIQVHKYWKSWIRKAEKAQPDDKWIEAEDAIRGGKTGKAEERPYENGARMQYEALKSFLDQNSPSFRITPAEAFISDEIVGKQAECDSAYLSHVWEDQECQKAQSQKLDSALQRNIGWTLPGFDKKKWMPNVIYLSPDSVYVDADAKGQLAKANAMAYHEDISLELLKSNHPDLTLEELDEIKSSGGSILEKAEQLKLDPETDEDELYATVRIYHVFARNDAAIRKTSEEEPDVMPSKSILEDLNLTTPKRYLQIVNGLERPLVDDAEWPYELDDNEFPLTPLRFNILTGSFYSYTDYWHHWHGARSAQYLSRNQK